MFVIVCGFRVHTKAKLRRHMKSHTGERDYEVNFAPFTINLINFHLFFSKIFISAEYATKNFCTAIMSSLT